MTFNRWMVRAVGVGVAGIVGITATAGVASAEKRDVVFDAGVICTGVNMDSPLNLQDACALLGDTRNPEVALFSGKPREGAQNLEAQSRKAASVVLSLDDVYARNKVPAQAQTAMNDACDYAAKSAELVAAGKVTYTESRDLGADAKALAAAIYDEWVGEFSDLVNPCA